MTTNQRTALITGSGQNIGRAIALNLADAGFQIVLNGAKNADNCNAVAKTIKENGGKAVVAMGDIGVREQALDIAQTGINAFGAIDVLVNLSLIHI